MISSRFGEHTDVWCGLIKIFRREEEWGPRIVKTPIPLVAVDVRASVAHAVAQVEVTQVYANKEDQPIEAIYYFPTNPDGAVTHFQAELEDRVIKGTVKPLKEAKQDYDEAVSKKRTAFLGRETDADIFKVRVGFLKPGSQVKVIIGYVTEVKNEPGTNAIRFYIPTTIAPRHVSLCDLSETATDIQEMTYAPSSPAQLSLRITVALQGGIKSIESPTHKITVDKQVWHKAIVQLSGDSTDMDRDFVLEILPMEAHKPSVYSEKSENGTTAMMVHLIPSFKLDEQKTELIFVLDRSASMKGPSMELAKNALLLFLHSMPADCYFNVVGFGSVYQFLFPSSVKYDDGSLGQAIAHAMSLSADMDGTAIMRPLRDIFGQPEIDGYSRQLFILTDGEIGNTDEVLGITKANANKARVFALGIGDGASHHLVEGVAKAGGGTSAFVTYKESIDKKVLNQLKNSMQPPLTDIELEWDGQPSATVDMSPKKIPPVNDGSQMLVIGLFKDAPPKSVSIKAQSPAGPLTIAVESSSENEFEQTGMLHRLAAIKLVRELELEICALPFQGLDDATIATAEWEKLEAEIVKIACQNGITSKFTSFVAIDTKGDDCADDWVMGTRKVPSQFAHGWAGGFSGRVSRRRMDWCASTVMISYDGAGPMRVRGSGPTIPCTEGSTVIQLASLQSFDGSFTQNEKIAAIVCKSLDEIKECAAKLNLQEQVFATALAISFFMTKLAAEEGAWELIVLKARKWLAKSIRSDQVDGTIEAAATFLGE